MKFRAAVALFFAFVVSFTAIPARAQMSDGEKKAAARAAYQEGVKLQDQGKPAEALAKFEAAQKLYDAPTHLLHIAECQALLGKLVEAAETYETIRRDQLPPGSPDVFVQAQEHAKQEAPALRERIPTLKITITPAPSTLQNLTITINDRQMPTELVGIARPVNPGSYRLSATANGYATKAPVELELREKEAKSIELVLVQGATGAVVVPVPPPYGTGTTGTPPPGTTDPNAQTPGADKPQTAPKPQEEKPSTGLLIGGHGGLFVPAGSVAQSTDFDKVGSAGGGIGIDFMARFAKVFLAGVRAEGIFLGGPDSRQVAAGQTITSTTNMFGAAVAVGLLTSSDRVGFYSDFGFGFRQLNYSQTAPSTIESSFNGSYFALGAGISIPAGPMRIVPKVGIDLGSLKPNDTKLTNAAGTVTNTVNTSALDTGSYQMFFVGLTLFYSHDLGKKPTTTGAASTRGLM